jgi:hypothetical protein
MYEQVADDTDRVGLQSLIYAYGIELKSHQDARLGGLLAVSWFLVLLSLRRSESAILDGLIRSSTSGGSAMIESQFGGGRGADRYCINPVMAVAKGLSRRPRE